MPDATALNPRLYREHVGEPQCWIIGLASNAPMHVLQVARCVMRPWERGSVWWLAECQRELRWPCGFLSWWCSWPKANVGEHSCDGFGGLGDLDDT